MTAEKKIAQKRFTLLQVAERIRNGKVERSHGTDEVEFYQLLTYTGDVDLNQKLTQWEEFYNMHRPHGSLKGHTPYEVLRTRLEG